MKIGIYDPYLDDLGGGEKYMMTIAECLSKKHEVSVFWDKKEDLDDLLKRFSIDLTKVKLCKNIFSPKVGFFEKIWETKKYDAIIFLSDGSIPFAFSRKLFLHLQQPLRYLSNSTLKNKLKLSRVTSVFYNSEFTKSFNAKILPQIKSTIIYPPVYFLTKNISKENIVLHVGRFRVRNVNLSDFKKQDVMVEVFKQMVDEKKVKDWKFVLAVSVKKEDEEKFALLQKSAKGYPIEFLINKSNDELWEIYNRAKIYWHASGYGEDLEKHPEYAEHFGISTVEAMGAGVVPVVINSGGQKEIVVDGKNGVLWDTLEELKQKTEILINDHEQLNKLSNEARKKSNDFSKEKFCKEITKLVEG